MKPQIEIEIKARISDKKAMTARLKELGAVYKGRKHQIDHYFSPPHKSLIGRGLYFRLRYDKLSKKSRLEYHIASKGKKYGKHSASAMSAKEYEIDISDYKTGLSILSLLEFKPEVVVDKIRDTYILKGVTIELDTVKRLGEFLEIEILNRNPETARRKILDIAKLLGIKEENISEKNYFNLLYSL